MKRCMLVFLVIVMLLVTGVSPHASYAQNDEKKSPEFWLNDEEKAYVASIKATEAEVRGNINYARLLLMDFNLDKAKEIEGEIAAIGSELGKFCSINAPPEFEAINTEYCSLANRHSGLSKYSTGSLFLPIADPLLETLYYVTDLERKLMKLEADLGKMSGKLKAQIADIAERREKAAEMVEKLFEKFCFIATAAYGTPDAGEIDILRKFRDEVLVLSPAGRAFIIFYYRTSPPIAQFVAEHEIMRMIVREFIIDPIVTVVDITGKWWSE